MDSRAKLVGHPVHQMLIVLPLGLLAMSVVFDILFYITHDGRWTSASFLMIGGGVITGLVAAVFGIIDWLAIPDGTRAKGIGLIHGVGNVVVVAFFGISWLVRREAPAAPPTSAVVLSFLGAALALVTGWLGGELVTRLGVGVDPGAHLNAPSSLSKRPASQTAGDESAVRPASTISRPTEVLRRQARPETAGRTAGLSDREPRPGEPDRDRHVESGEKQVSPADRRRGGPTEMDI